MNIYKKVIEYKNKCNKYLKITEVAREDRKITSTYMLKNVKEKLLTLESIINNEEFIKKNIENELKEIKKVFFHVSRMLDIDENIIEHYKK